MKCGKKQKHIRTDYIAAETYKKVTELEQLLKRCKEESPEQKDNVQQRRLPEYQLLITLEEILYGIEKIIINVNRTWHTYNHSLAVELNKFDELQHRQFKLLQSENQQLREKTTTLATEMRSEKELSVQLAQHTKSAKQNRDQTEALLVHDGSFIASVKAIIGTKQLPQTALAQLKTLDEMHTKTAPSSINDPQQKKAVPSSEATPAEERHKADLAKKIDAEQQRKADLAKEIAAEQKRKTDLAKEIHAIAEHLMHGAIELKNIRWPERASWTKSINDLHSEIERSYKALPQKNQFIEKAYLQMTDEHLTRLFDALHARILEWRKILCEWQLASHYNSHLRRAMVLFKELRCKEFVRVLSENETLSHQYCIAEAEKLAQNEIHELRGRVKQAAIEAKAAEQRCQDAADAQGQVRTLKMIIRQQQTAPAAIIAELCAELIPASPQGTASTPSLGTSHCALLSAPHPFTRHSQSHTAAGVSQKLDR